MWKVHSGLFEIERYLLSSDCHDQFLMTSNTIHDNKVVGETLNFDGVSLGEWACISDGLLWGRPVYMNDWKRKSTNRESYAACRVRQLKIQTTTTTTIEKRQPLESFTLSELKLLYYRLAMK